jgi:hypothetical protein
LWLVRPDGYVDAVASVDDITPLADHLDTLAYR